MSYTTRTDEELWFLVSQPLSECVKRWPHLTYNTLKGKRGYWRKKLKINIDEGNIARMENLKYNTPPEEPEIDRNTELAIEFLSTAPTGTESLLDLYEQQNDRVTEIHIETDKPSIKTLYLNEILIGHKDADIKFLTSVIEQIPDDIDAIMVSGILQGDFKLLQKARRKSLAPGLDSMDRQFYYAKQILDQLVDTGKPVIYNLSNDDRRVAEEYTIEQFRIMLDLANAADKVNYYQIDKMKTHPKWQEHLAFQTSYVMPYCLRSGRRLRTAEEIKALSNDDMDVSEYLMLFDAFKRLERGEDPNPDYLPYIEAENLGDTTFKITDDFNLSVKTTSAEHQDWVRHNVSFSNEPMYNSFMNVPYEMIGHLAASGQETPSMFVLQHNLEEIGIQKDGTWIVSCGGMINANRFIGSKGSKTDIAGDQSRRLNTTRRRVPSPSASAHERFDDGRHIVTLYNENLLKKADSCPRTALPLLTDWQIGSLTARPDLLVKYLDYIRTIDEEKVLYFNGDFIQGRNYPNYPNENQMLGLISIESQAGFVSKLLREFLKPDEKVKKAFVTVGNHEFNSGTVKWHGDTFTRYLRDALEAKGYTAQFNEGLMTRKGEHFRAWAAIDYVGDYGIYVTHMPLMKGAKGGGGLPIYQAATHSTGLGEAKRSIDFEMYGHWHHPQYAMFGDKVAVISGSLAGMSGYEWERGYRPVINSVILHIGGGQPPQLEFLSEQFLHNYQIDWQSPYEDDEGFDASQHGIFLPRKFPKSGLQKYILELIADAAEGQVGELR